MLATGFNLASSASFASLEQGTVDGQVTNWMKKLQTLDMAHCARVWNVDDK
jgi:hypothetical protein